MSYRIAIEILPSDIGDATEIAHRRREQFSDVSGHSYEVVGEFDRLAHVQQFAAAIRRAIGGERITFNRAPNSPAATLDVTHHGASQPAVSRVLPYDKHFIPEGRRGWLISRWGTLIRECSGMNESQVQAVVDTLNELETSRNGAHR